MPLVTSLLGEHLDRLAALEPTPYPFLSLYLNTQADQHGKNNFQAFVRKEFHGRANTYPVHSPERQSFDRDTERIQEYLRDELRPSANGIAIFACSGSDDFFDAVQLEAPLMKHLLFVDSLPHLYPLAVIDDQYRRYAALITDSNSARLFVFGLGERLDQKHVQSPKINRTSVGGWSQARYQRHVDNNYLHHAKEVIAILERTVQEDKIQQIVLAGDETILPVVREHLPAGLAGMIVEVSHLHMKTPDHEVLRASLEAIRMKDAQNDAEKVERLLNSYRAGALGVVGVRQTMIALMNGQVDELLITGSVETIHPEPDETGELAAYNDPAAERLSSGPQSVETLVAQARKTGARVTFIENPKLLADVGGLGALLRYRMDSQGGPNNIITNKPEKEKSAMGKSNVNPDHYTQAGRERQGEDIVHELEKHRYAQNRAAQEAQKRFPNQRAAAPATEQKPAEPAGAPGRKQGSKSQATDVKGKSGNLQEARATAERREARMDRKRDTSDEQTSGKRGARSSAQKSEAARHGLEPMPASKKVSGARGKSTKRSAATHSSMASGSIPSANKRRAGQKSAGKESRPKSKR
jgi:peptide chain release factor subunit 1